MNYKSIPKYRNFIDYELKLEKNGTSSLINNQRVIFNAAGLSKLIAVYTVSEMNADTMNEEEIVKKRNDLMRSSNFYDRTLLSYVLGVIEIEKLSTFIQFKNILNTEYRWYNRFVNEDIHNFVQEYLIDQINTYRLHDLGHYYAMRFGYYVERDDEFVEGIKRLRAEFENEYSKDLGKFLKAEFLEVYNDTPLIASKLDLDFVVRVIFCLMYYSNATKRLLNDYGRKLQLHPNEFKNNTEKCKKLCLALVRRGPDLGRKKYLGPKLR